MFTTYRASVFAFAALTSLGLGPLPAHAHEAALSVGRGFICDTATEVAAVVTSDDNAIRARVASVNNQFGKDACTFATTIFYSDADAKTATTPEGVASIEKVEMVGYLVGDELQKIAKPKEQYFGVIAAAPAV